jgi:hypothetical protein
LRSLILLPFICLFFLKGNSQINQDTLGVSDFNSSISGLNKFLPLLTEKTADIINSTSRVFLVDLTSTNSIDNAINRAQENYKGNWINDKAKINPKKIIIGEVTILKFIKAVSTSNPGYKSNLQIVLKIVETETSKIVDTYEFISQSNGVFITQENALQDAISSLSPSITDWVNKRFPLKLKCVKIQKESTKAVEQLILAGGSKLRIGEGDKFDIIYLDNNFSPAIPELIGEGEIKSIINEDYSVLQIIDGDKSKLKKILSGDLQKSIYFKSK